jgi:hypothetical protein
MSKISQSLPPSWDEIITAACRFREIIPDAVLIGGCAVIIHAGHRMSYDIDHWIGDLKTNFVDVLSTLESANGWNTAWTKGLLSILGTIDGVKASIRHVPITSSLETITVNYKGMTFVIPTEAEIIRMKSLAVVMRHLTRDFIDLAALTEHFGSQKTIVALNQLDRLFPLPNNQSTLQLLRDTLSNPAPKDFKQINFKNYRNLSPQWQNWENTVSILKQLAINFHNTEHEDAEPPSHSPRF